MYLALDKAPAAAVVDAEAERAAQGAMSAEERKKLRQKQRKVCSLICRSSHVPDLCVCLPKGSLSLPGACRDDACMASRWQSQIRWQSGLMEVHGVIHEQHM